MAQQKHAKATIRRPQHLFRLSAMALAGNLVLISLLGGCASELPNEKILRTEAINNTPRLADPKKSAAAQDEIGQRFLKAQGSGLGFYAPGYMKIAAESLEKAHKAGSSASSATAMLTAANALDNAEATRTDTKKVFAESLEELAFLVAHEAHLAQGPAFMDALSDVQDMLRDHENGKHDKDRDNQAKIMLTLQKVEVEALLYQQLHRAHETLRLADSEDADSMASKAYKQAELDLQNAERQIRLKPRDREVVDAAANNAYISCLHARSLGAAVRSAFDKLDLPKTPPESIEKLYEVQQHWLNKGFENLGIIAPVYLSPDEQAALLVKMIADMKTGALTRPDALDHVEHHYAANPPKIQYLLPLDYPSWRASESASDSSNDTAEVITQGIAPPPVNAQEIPLETSTLPAEQSN